MASSHRKKLVRQKAIHSPPPPIPLQSLFIQENNLTWNNNQPYYPDPLSAESSTSSNVDSNSSNPVVVSSKFLYRRR
jgi:hypothetical protein